MGTQTPPIFSPTALEIRELENKIRVFSNERLQSSIQKALSAIPTDKKAAVLYHMDGNGFTLSAVARTSNGDWTIMAAGFKPYNGPISAEAAVVWTPF